MTTKIYSAPEMSCQHCVDAVTKEVTALAGVDAVNIDLDAKTVAVQVDESAAPSSEAIIDAIDEAGFDATALG